MDGATVSVHQKATGGVEGIRGVSFNALLADKAFDANWLLEDLDKRGATSVIAPKPNRKYMRAYDAVVYK